MAPKVLAFCPDGTSKHLSDSVQVIFPYLITIN